MTPDMAPVDDKVRVTARISKDLDTRIHRFYTNMAPAIIEGLELLATSKESALSPNDTNKIIEGTDKDTKDLEAQLIDKEKTIGDLERKLGDKDIIIGEKEKQIGDKEREIEFLKGQIAIKDQQLDKQAFSLQSVIQENSRLNLKLLPESQETNNTQEQKLTRWQHLKGFIFGPQ
jgi:septal ring factor EnvC (AmiA/AmiB activator)